MGFGQLKEWAPNLTHVDPRISEQYTTGSKYVVLSVTRHPTYLQLSKAQETVADSKLLGLIQNFSAPQARPIVRIYEIGSRYPYSVAGKFTGNFALSSVFFDASGNIIGNIYDTVYGVDGLPSVGVSDVDKAIGNRLLNRPQLFEEGGPIKYSMADVGGAETSAKRDGVGSMRFSIDDNAIDKPFGLVMSIFQSEKRIKSIASVTGTAGANQAFPPNGVENFKIAACLFFEMCKITDYSFGFSAESEIISENASFFYSGLVNVKTALESAAGDPFNRTALELPNQISSIV